eukprot:910358-Pleurochrysis_carterae.AAC.6
MRGVWMGEGEWNAAALDNSEHSDEEHGRLGVVEDVVVGDSHLAADRVDGDARARVGVDVVRLDTHLGIVPRGDAVAKGAADHVSYQAHFPAIRDHVGAAARVGNRVAFGLERAPVHLDAWAHGARDEVARHEDGGGGADPYARLRPVEALAVDGWAAATLLRGWARARVERVGGVGKAVKGVEGLGDRCGAAAARDAAAIEEEPRCLGEDDRVRVADVVAEAAERQPREARRRARADDNVLRTAQHSVARAYHAATIAAAAAATDVADAGHALSAA